MLVYFTINACHVLRGALLELSFELFLAWIFKIQQAYEKGPDPNYIKKGKETA